MLLSWFLDLHRKHRTISPYLEKNGACFLDSQPSYPPSPFPPHRPHLTTLPLRQGVSPQEIVNEVVNSPPGKGGGVVNEVVNPDPHPGGSVSVHDFGPGPCGAGKFLSREFTTSKS